MDSFLAGIERRGYQRFQNMSAERVEKACERWSRVTREERDTLRSRLRNMSQEERAIVCCFFLQTLQDRRRSRLKQAH